VVEWLQQQEGVQFGARALSCAAVTGQTTMSAHLRGIGCDWDAEACRLAAVFGHYDTLRWLRENGCPWEAEVAFFDVSRYGYTSILSYFIEQGEVIEPGTLTEALNCAGASGHLQTAQWLRQLGAQWPNPLSFDFHETVGHWSGEVLAWARAEGCTSSVADDDSD
jgi:hypothetical protein